MKRKLVFSSRAPIDFGYHRWLAQAVLSGVWPKLPMLDKPAVRPNKTAGYAERSTDSLR